MITLIFIESWTKGIAAAARIHSIKANTSITVEGKYVSAYIQFSVSKKWWLKQTLRKVVWMVNPKQKSRVIDILCLQTIYLSLSASFAIMAVMKNVLTERIMLLQWHFRISEDHMPEWHLTQFLLNRSPLRSYDPMFCGTVQVTRIRR